jgi:hypothetical protein
MTTMAPFLLATQQKITHRTGMVLTCQMASFWEHVLTEIAAVKQPTDSWTKGLPRESFERIRNSVQQPVL